MVNGKKDAIAPLSLPDGSLAPVYVLATNVHAISRALDLARTLAREHHQRLAVLVSGPRRTTVSSARAHAYDLPIEWSAPEGHATRDEVLQLVASEREEIDVQSVDLYDLYEFERVVPVGATVVISGSMNRYFQTQVQRLARQLTTRGYRVVYLPEHS